MFNVGICGMRYFKYSYRHLKDGLALMFDMNVLVFCKNKLFNSVQILKSIELI